MATDEKMMYSMLVQINNNLMALKRVIEKMQEDGINVRTQESHMP